MGQNGNNQRGRGRGFFNNLFSGNYGTGIRRNFSAAANMQSRAPEVIAQSPDSRITLYDDNSTSGVGARHAATRLYGPQGAASVGRRSVIEVQGPDGQWAPVNQADPGAPMDAQIAALQAFRQTGQLGSENQTGFVNSDALPGAELGANDSNAQLFGPAPNGGAGAAASDGTALVTTPQITENALPALTPNGAPAIPQDPNNPTGFGDKPLIGFTYDQSTPGLPQDPNGPTGPGAGGVAEAPALVQSGSAGNASGQNGQAAPDYQANADAQLGANGAVIANGAGGRASGPQDVAFTDPAMQSYADAITSIESEFLGGRTQQYAALGRVMESGAYAGDRAYGRYQVMGRNIPEWTKQALGVTMTPEQFLADPDAQDAVFADQFRRNIEKYGSPEDAASVWFTGRPASDASGQTASDGNLTGAQYVARFNAALGGAAPDGNTGPPRGGPNPTQGPRAAAVANNAQDQSGAGSSPTTNQDDTLISNAHQFAAPAFITQGGGESGARSGSAPAPIVQLASLNQQTAQYKFF